MTGRVVPIRRSNERLVAMVESNMADRIATWCENEGTRCAREGSPHEANAWFQAMRGIKRGDWR